MVKHDRKHKGDNPIPVRLSEYEKWRWENHWKKIPKLKKKDK